MDEKLRGADIRSKMKPSAKKKEEVRPKSPPIFPIAAERELGRFSNWYMGTYADELAVYMPMIASAYEKARKRRQEAEWAEFLTLLYFYLSESEGVAAEVAVGETFIQRLDKIAHQVERATIKGWEKCVKAALGVDIDPKYYEGDFSSDKVRDFLDVCSGELKEGPRYASQEITTAFENGYMDNVPIKDLRGIVQDRYKVSVDKTRNIVRTHVGDLNAGLFEKMCNDSGVGEYIWRTCLDDRVRPCHAELEGTRHFFNAPPEMWYDTKSMGVIYTGRRCNPGEDYNCRCVAVPVFRVGDVNLPVRGG